MKNNIFKVLFVVFIIILSNFLVYFFLKQYISYYIPKSIKDTILSIEYNKVGGKENYLKINEINRQQIEAFLSQYESQNGSIDIDDKSVNNDNPIYNKSGLNTIDKETLNEILSDVYILGNPDAEITFIEYSDLECPFCKRLHVSGTIDKVLEYYSGKVNFVFKHFPLSFHENAQKEAEAVECVGELGGTEKYYKYLNEIFKRTKSNGKGFPLSGLRPLAEELGIDGDKFQECLDSGKYAKKVKDNMEEGIRLFNVSGTPGNILINKKTLKWDKLPGAYPFESFVEKIDNLLTN